MPIGFKLKSNSSMVYGGDIHSFHYISLDPTIFGVGEGIEKSHIVYLSHKGVIYILVELLNLIWFYDEI